MIASADTMSRPLEPLLRFAHTFRGIFSRSEHLRWFSVYLWGLIESPGRRSIEAIARSLPNEFLPVGASASQALQHFLSRSNWDDRRLLAQLRKQLLPIGEPGSAWVVHEVVCLKRGRHSVGVHRQYLRDHGLKANSQTGVLISQVGPSGYLPLAVRLYLPRGWLEQARPTQLSEIPPEAREPLAKDVIAIQLLEELLAEGKRPGAVASTNGFTSSNDLADFITRQQLIGSIDSDTTTAAEKGRESLKRQLGLDHYEGRSWRGWHHHAASVLAAHAFLQMAGEAS